MISQMFLGALLINQSWAAASVCIIGRNYDINHWWWLLSKGCARLDSAANDADSYPPTWCHQQSSFKCWTRLAMGKATNETIKTRGAALKGLILSVSSNSTCVEHAAQKWSYRVVSRIACWNEHGLKSAKTWTPLVLTVKCSAGPFTSWWPLLVKASKTSSRQSLLAPVASLMRCC